MNGSIGTKTAIGLMIAGLMLTGALVGASYGGVNAIVAPETIVLVTSGDTVSRDYPMRDEAGRRNGHLSVIRERVLDEDGNPAGTVFSQCFFARNMAWRCDLIARLIDGPHTDVGTIHLAGLFRGYVGESFAVTGGTGAYSNVRGDAVLSVENEESCGRCT